MDDTNNNDVNIQPDMATGDVPSNIEQTSSDSDVTENASTPAEEVKTVPYDRFKEVNEKVGAYSQTVQQLQAELQEMKIRQELAQQMQPAYQQPQVNPEELQQKQAIKQQLQPFFEELAREQGFVSKAELQAQEQQKRVDAEIATMKTRYDGKDGLPVFDEKAVIKHAIDNGFNNLDKAYKDMHEAEVINWHVQQAIAKSRGLTTENSNSTGSTQVGVTDNDLMTAATKGDTEAQKLFAKRLLSGVKKL